MINEVKIYLYARTSYCTLKILEFMRDHRPLVGSHWRCSMEKDNLKENMDQVKEETIDSMKLEQKYVDTNNIEDFWIGQNKDEMCQIKEETKSNDALTEEVSICEKPATDSQFNLDLVKIEHQDEMCQIKEETESNESGGPLTEEGWIEEKPKTDPLLNLDIVKIEHQAEICLIKGESDKTIEDESNASEEPSLSTIPSLKMQMHMHTGRHPFVCKLCTKTFSRFSNLKNHFMRIHTSERPFLCKLCSKSFLRSNDLRVHMRIHTGERPFVCKVCSKSYKASTSLKDHMLTHTGERPFVCKICCNSFSVRSSFKNHLRTHSAE